MTAYRCTFERSAMSDLPDRSDASDKTHTELRWVPRGQLTEFAMPKVILKFLDMV